MEIILRWTEYTVWAYNEPSFAARQAGMPRIVSVLILVIIAGVFFTGGLIALISESKPAWIKSLGRPPTLKKKNS